MRAPLALVTAVVVITTALAACTAPDPGAPKPEAVAAPTSVGEVSANAELYRTRSDPARGGVQLSVSNTADIPLTVLRVVLDSPALAAPIERDRTTVIPAGATRDLALLLPEPQCSSGPTLPDAVLTVALSSGATGEVRLRTTDRLGQWVDWHAAACFASAAAAQVDLDLRRAPALDDRATGTIGAEIIATARSDHVTLVAIDDTVLFALLDDPATASRVSMLTFDRRLPVGETAVVPLHLAVARCDAHAVAEDKQGTLFSVHLDLGGSAGRTFVVADETTRNALYDAIAETCRF